MASLVVLHGLTDSRKGPTIYVHCSWGPTCNDGIADAVQYVFGASDRITFL